jgi:hypothetical protein
MRPILATHLAFILAIPSNENSGLERKLLREKIRYCYELFLGGAKDSTKVSAGLGK